jgi:hypothetical protein
VTELNSPSSEAPGRRGAGFFPTLGPASPPDHPNVNQQSAIPHWIPDLTTGPLTCRLIHENGRRENYDPLAGRHGLSHMRPNQARSRWISVAFLHMHTNGMLPVVSRFFVRAIQHNGATPVSPRMCITALPAMFYHATSISITSPSLPCEDSLVILARLAVLPPPLVVPGNQPPWFSLQSSTSSLWASSPPWDLSFLDTISESSLKCE